MNESRESRGVNVPLLIGLGLVGLLFLALWSGGCVSRTFGWQHGWPWIHGWNFDLRSGMLSMFGLWGLIQVALAMWVGVDAQRRGLSGPLWGLLVLFTSVVGLIVYLLVAPTLEAQAANGRSAPPPPAPPAAGACRACRTPLQPGFRVCPQCGTPAQRACGSCERPLEQDWKVCPYCGTLTGPPEDPGA